MQPQIDLSKLENVSCECGSKVFDQHFIIKKLSKFHSPNGMDTIMPVPAYICNACGKYLGDDKEVLPDKDKEKPFFRGLSKGKKDETTKH